MSEPLEHDPRTLRAIARARRAHVEASEVWTTEDDEDDPAAEAEQLARDALAHLEGGRWDEARACGEAAAGLAEEQGEDVWREFAILVDEAAETGRAAPSPGS
ncbi:hypothetical protein G6O69_14425 [Pseudenhygromyxa sp. WMMC2535]|uniref:hypothetical protein n=1 Tax=Pseudenhygromyxa sp. WMMC2535 TaxID=2712867 RepID=UPI001552B748|nr:hypothetical protein [Pseudenhygromyxa sp. WMMC2535]NVB39035.1 hypothetical protein [Pseudenhygromyxa sp. WMMC2535]